MTGPGPEFTILLPVVRPPDMLPHAVASVLAQTTPRFELFIVCDGAPPETVAAAEALAARDPRVRVRAFPKGARHGEAHRAAVMTEATGRLVAQLGDDDLWLPDHLAQVSRLLARADFVSLPQIRAMPDGGLIAMPYGDLADPRTRAAMQAPPVWNFFGPTEAGWRMSAYRALPVGWSPAPPDLPTDLHMWRKFLVLPELRAVTGFTPTSVKFGAVQWDAAPPAERAAALAAMRARFADPTALRALRRTMRRLLASRLPDRRLARLALERPSEGLPLLALRLRAAAGRRLRRAAGA